MLKSKNLAFGKNLEGLRPILRSNMKISELRLKSNNELQKIMQDNRERFRQLSFDLVAGKVKNVREIRKIKKDIARILTLSNPKSKIN